MPVAFLILPAVRVWLLPPFQFVGAVPSMLVVRYLGSTSGRLRQRSSYHTFPGQGSYCALSGGMVV